MDPRSPASVGSDWRESFEPRLCRWGCRKPRQSVEQFADSPRRDCAAFIWITASMSSWLGPLAPGLPPRWEEKSNRYLRFLRAWWRLKRVEGFSTMAERIRRAGRMRRAHKPATRRSEVRRFGDRCRERLRIKSCCLTRTDSATTERMPPGPKSRARVAMTWTKRMTSSRTSAS